MTEEINWEELEDLTSTDWICPGTCEEGVDWEWEAVYEEEGNDQTSLVGKRRKRRV